MKHETALWPPTYKAGVSAYGGACPPEGGASHRYVFTVYALSTPSVGLPAEASGAMVGLFDDGSTLASDAIIVTYKR